MNSDENPGKGRQEMADIKFSICNELFEGWSQEDVFRYVAEAGYDGVEIAPFTLARSVVDVGPERREQLRREAEREGLEMVGLHWLLASPEGLYLNHPDEQVRKTTQDYMAELIRFCGDLGGKRMIMGSPKQRNVMAGCTYQEAWDFTKEVFRSLLPVAEKSGVILCIEPLDRGQTNFINTPDEAARLVKEIGHPNFKLMLDVKATVNQGESVVEAIRQFGPDIAHFHANDANGRGPGFGDVDFTPIAQALKEIDYGGYVSVEVFDFKPDPRAITRKSLDYLKRVFPVE